MNFCRFKLGFPISFWFRHSEFRRSLSKREIARFCGQLQLLLSSGVPLLEALRIVKDVLRRKEYEGLIQQVSEGHSLAAAMQELFPPMVISSVAGAERAGNLEETLCYLSGYYEERAEIEEKVKSALIYPAFIIFLCSASLILMIFFVLPGFKSLFGDLDADLPLFTRVLMDLGDMVSRSGLFMLILIIILVTAFLRFRRTEKGALVLDRVFLRSRWIRGEQSAQCFRTMGSLLRAGLPITEALEAAIRSCQNRAFVRIVFEIKEAVENGEKLSEVLSRRKIFPCGTAQMISVGENTGRLAEMLLSVADLYEKEREVFLKRFAIMLEPALTLFVGIMVGFIAIAMFLPMVNMISKLQ
jgi:type IV pilus assembly protein PilC